MFFLVCTGMPCLEKILSSFSDTPTTYGTRMLLSLLFFSLSGVPLWFVGLFVDVMKAKLGEPQIFFM